MWFNILPSYLVVTFGIAFPGYGLWWLHYYTLGNALIALSLAEIIAGYDVGKMWYEILPTFFVITAGLGLPGWALYHLHNATLGNHFRRTMIDRWDRMCYQRDMRLTGSPYVVNGLDSLPDK